MEVTNWRKSSYSSTNGGNCVEASNDSHGVLVRDSQDKNSAHLATPSASWSAFIGRVKRDK
jgi:hypothetical protein